MITASEHSTLRSDHTLGLEFNEPMRPYLLAILTVLATVTAQGQGGPLHLNITSHNEMQGENYVGDQLLFNAAVANYTDVLGAIQAHDARWNMQTCSRFVVAALQHQDAYTEPDDIIETLWNSGVVQIDPRNKTIGGFPQYDLADVAVLIDSCGAEASHIMGGFLYFPYPGEDWTDYQVPAPGNILDVPWDIDIIWGGGSPGHINDANDFGVWKPQGGSDSVSFYTHAACNHLWMVGNGCGLLLTDTTPVIDVYNDIAFHVQAITSGAWPSDRFYCESVMLNTRDMGATLTAKLDSLLDMLDPLVSSGDIVWETIGAKLDAFQDWSAQNQVAYCQWNCDSDISTGLGSNDGADVSVRAVDSGLLVHGRSTPMTLRLWDAMGRQVLRSMVRDGDLVRVDGTSGLVIAELECGGSRYRWKRILY